MEKRKGSEQEVLNGEEEGEHEQEVLNGEDEGKRKRS